ncbi:MAG: EAL domain-containing protein [Paracoccaceae bacterium]|nr:EAL domain-containing protein [Paracoccaceae bacterium]
MIRSSFRDYLRPFAIAFLVIGASALAISQWKDDLVDRTLLGHAESSAVTWRAEFIRSVPEIEGLFTREDVAEQQRSAVEASMAGSDIFRFEAFNPAGALTFVSDRAFFEVEDASQFNATAAQVAVSGETIVVVKDGSENRYRPDHYVAAYMPVNSDAGDNVGVFEVYVDATGLANALRQKFSILSLLLVSATAAIYLVPSLMLIRRNKELRERDRELLKLSERDSLTGLLNRGAFNEQLNSLFKSIKDTRADIGLLFVDIDQFKETNDTYGHAIGDKLLQGIAKILVEATRDKDIVARLGGDEFVIVCPDIDLDDLSAIGARLIDMTDRPLRCGDQEIGTGLSIGAHLSAEGESERWAMHRADLALYWAKVNGRGQVALYSDKIEKREIRRRSVEADVRAGLDKGRFFLEFQPIYDNATRVVGFEALLRLRTRDGDLISPEEFIPIAENIGLIGDLGRWVLMAATQAATAWPAPLFVAVNISANQFQTETLNKDLAAALDASGLDGTRVCLELTEQVLLDEQNSVTDQLAALRGLGVQIAIDDFGTGYSSLSYLWRYDFQHLKIDKSFFEAYSFDKARYGRVIEMIISLGHQLDMSVTVEGIETQEQFDFIRSTPCDCLQGFLLSRPVSEMHARVLSGKATAA